MRVLVMLLWMPLFSLAQNTIKGKVVNESTGSPVGGSSVFINNSSKGTVTNSDGWFELQDIPAGKHDLIVSSIGYETYVYSFNTDKLPLQLKVEMKIKVQVMDNVTLESSVEEGWDKWGKLFTDNFIGIANNAGDCRIVNKDDIKFRYFKRSNRVIAYSELPVQIENNALGYKIRYQLESFEVNFSNRTTVYTGYPFFEDMEVTKKQRNQSWINERREAYYGSITHFMYALYHNRLREEGFEVRRMVQKPNEEKARIRRFYQGSGVIYKTNRATGETVMDLSEGLKDYPKDSVKYYQKIAAQPDIIDVYGDSLLTGDSLIVKTDGEYKAIYFDHFLHITYKNEPEAKKYVRLTMEDRKPGPQRSLAFILTENILSIDKKGNYYNPKDFFTSGYWGWSEKVADLLPLDYEPVRQ